jgi:hypothetical protein
LRERKSILRLRKKHSGGLEPPRRRPDPVKLLQAQSTAGAMVGGLGALVLMSAVWTCAALLSDRVFPWFSIVQGAAIGLAVRRYGRGIHWRFPVLAAVLAWTGAFLGNFVIALPTTTGELGASAFEVLRGLTWWSFETFFDEVITVVDYIYAFSAAAVAAFWSKRRLNRHEVYALRTMNEGKNR